MKPTYSKIFFLAMPIIMLGGCSDPARVAAAYGASEQEVAQCKFEASRRDGVAWPDEVALCLKGKGLGK